MEMALLMIRYSPGGAGAFIEYNSLAELCDGICEQYERGLKLCLSQNGGGNKLISYGMGELMDYLDATESVKVMLRRTGGDWTEYDKDWTKRTLTSHLKQQLLNNTIA
jgi:hypothetical protein